MNDSVKPKKVVISMPAAVSEVRIEKDEIKDFEGGQIGYVTSGTQSPSLGKAIGLGYVESRYAAIDAEIFIKVRSTLLRAKVVKIPFA